MVLNKYKFRQRRIHSANPPAISYGLSTIVSQYMLPRTGGGGATNKRSEAIGKPRARVAEGSLSPKRVLFVSAETFEWSVYWRTSTRW